jgi:hypothetical protein
MAVIITSAIVSRTRLTVFFFADRQRIQWRVFVRSAPACNLIQKIAHHTKQVSSTSRFAKV